MNVHYVAIARFIMVIVTDTRTHLYSKRCMAVLMDYCSYINQITISSLKYSYIPFPRTTYLTIDLQIMV